MRRLQSRDVCPTAKPSVEMRHLSAPEASQACSLANQCSDLVRSLLPPRNLQLDNRRPHHLTLTLFSFLAAHPEFGWQSAAGLKRFEK
jgi:hypothetical protein